MVTKKHLMLFRFFFLSLIFVCVCVAHHDMDDKTAAGRASPMGRLMLKHPTSLYYYDSPYR
jgi:hypothetical protein